MKTRTGLRHLMTGMTLIIFLIGCGIVHSQQKAQAQDIDPQKKAALDDAMRNGLLTQQEYNAKLQALKAATAPARPAASTPARPAAPGIDPSRMAAGRADDGRSTPKGMQTAFIHDPVLDQDAFGVRFPAKWHFQGTILQGTQCSSIPFPVFRAFSPDGLTVLEGLPRFDWGWGGLWRYATDQGDCLPLKEAMSAKDSLKYISAMLNVEYIGEEPVPQYMVDAGNANLKQLSDAYAPLWRNSGSQPPVQTEQMARATVRYRNGSFTMKGLLHATVDCSQVYYTSVVPGAPPEVSNSCWALVGYIHAPEAQYQAAITLLDQAGGFDIPEFFSAWMANSNQKAQAVIAGIRIEGDRALAANAAQFEHTQKVRQQMHEEFMSTMQRGTTLSMNRANEIANRNHTIASDWVDYSLDQQTVRDPNTGQINKVSSAYTYTWIDSSGTVSYQTLYPDANPNGVLQGNWTRQQQVHGDGTNK